MGNITGTELLVKMAQVEGASDLLVTDGKPPQLRIYGELVSVEGYGNLTAEDTELICMSLINSEQIATFKKDREFDGSVFIDGVGRFRINLYLQKGSAALVARRVVESIPGFESLLLPDIIRKFAMLPRGLVLVTGPVGSGKSTTVACMVDYINRSRKCHIVSIEDPIEYVHSHILSTIDQREVGMDTHTFHEALRRVLRQSPDVVVIGEIRDRESAQAALTLAETGHLTLATLHTRGSISSVNRFVDMFPSEQIAQVRNQLSSCLAGVVWQQLLPKKYVDGLVVACEIMNVIPSIRALIRQGRTHEIFSIIQSGKKYSMTTMDQALEQLAGSDMIDLAMLSERCPDFAAMAN